MQSYEIFRSYTLSLGYYLLYQRGIPGIGLPSLWACYVHLTAEPVVVGHTEADFYVCLPLVALT